MENMTQQQSKTLNGVDVDGLFQSIGVIKKEPSVAKFNFRAKNEWVSGSESRTTIDDFYGAGKTHVRSKPFVFIKDEPPVLLGKDHGANPVEYALTALAGCVTTTLIFHAAARGVKINKVESTLEGDIDIRGLLNLDDSVKVGYESIQINFKIDSDASEETLQELVELGKKHSPVANTITNATPVNITLSKK
ncbi:MAG: OsmC family protein [Nitrosopumilaceae archaeon]